MNFNVRWADASDIDFLQCGVMQLLCELRGCPVDLAQIDWKHTVAHFISEQENYGILIVENDEKQIGLITFAVLTALHCGKYAMIEELWVLEDYRNAGAGKLLIEGLERYCVEHEIKRIDVGLPGNSYQHFNKTNAFYSGCGFIDVGLRKKKVIE